MIIVFFVQNEKIFLRYHKKLSVAIDVLYFNKRSFQCFLTVFEAVLFKGGVHLIAEVSTVNLGLLYSEDFICSSTNLGVTQITCCPFQYLTRFKACNVEMMSGCVIEVMALKSLILKVPLKSLRISRRTQDQYDR